MHSRGNSRQTNMIYGATRQHHPYSQTAPASAHIVPELVLPIPCDYPCDKDLCDPNDFQSSGRDRLLSTLYSGSNPSLLHIPTRFDQGTSGKHHSSVRMEAHQNNHHSIQGQWNPSTTTPVSTPLAHSSSQSSVCSVSSRDPHSGVANRGKSLKRSPGSPSKRPTPDDFRSTVLYPHNHQPLLLEYVGTDSKYTLARNHAGMMVRSSIKSQDMAGKMREVAEPLDAIDIFLGFLLDYQGLKPEQRGCVSLRICFGALTALLGDFSQGTSVENFVSDPHAAVIPREHLAQFRSFNPKLREILCRLSAKLEKSMNLYRHRRSPSSSLVAKFQEMSDTLEVWNQNLMDNTFEIPARIASDWLKNHPTQVDNRRRNQAFNDQASPALSDNARPSPSQCDPSYYSPMSVYGEPSRPSNSGTVRSIATDGSNQCESLFKTSTGVTYFGSNVTSVSVPYNNHSYRTPGDFDEGLNVPPMPDPLGVFPHQSHSPSTVQYHATGSGFRGF